MENESIKIACVGDSITYGLKLEDREDDCYPSTLERMLNLRGNGHVYRVGNFGVSGACVWHRRALRYSDTPECERAAAWRADAYVVCLGTNDAAGRTDGPFSAEFAEDYRVIVSRLRRDAPDAAVFLARIPPVPRFPQLAGAVDLVNGIVCAVARECGAALVDVHGAFSGGEGLFTDGVHPNPAGARVMAGAVFEALLGTILCLEETAPRDVH